MRNYLLMTTAAALCAVPLLAFGQANTGGSSTMPQATQTTPQGAAGTPAARDAPANNQQGGSAPGASAQANPRDGTPGNPPSTATGRAADAVTGQRSDPDGTGNNPPGTAAGRAVDRATGSNTTGANPAGTAGPTATPGTGTTRPSTAATTGAAGSIAAVDSARMAGGRRASKVIGSTIYNENNESIGEVDDLIIAAGTTQPVVIISVGGFLGIGAHLVAVPYERLQHATDRDRWMLQGATKDSLRGLPEFRYEGDTVQRRG
ncbi:PRC-barrel domain-containing protein [Falsiroseomonas sp. HW251]|uniref:PRC-barrel domain-containing protein n=1 Tax=Falsiroseomonas sp. HW251 TaxID=3390998 RepID=UPI003D31245E